MPATSGALAAAMMAATAVAGGSKFFDEVTHKKAEDHQAPAPPAAQLSNDSGVTESPAENATDVNIIIISSDDLPANFKEPSGPVSCDCKDHLDKLEGEMEFPISAKKLFTYLFSEEKTGPAENGGVWNKMNTSKGNSGLSVTKWSTNGEGKPERVLKYIMPVNNPMVKVKETEVVETQNIVKQDEHLCYVVTASTKTAQLPYADAFLPCLRFCITWVGKNRCKLQCHIGVKWLKSIMVKSMVNKAAIKGMSDTIAALLPLIKVDVSNMGYPAGKAPEAEGAADKAAAAADAEKGEVANANDIGVKAKAPERGVFSWMSNLYNLTTLQILLVAIGLTLLLWRVQVSRSSDKNTPSEQVIHSRAVYLKDIEKDLIDSKTSLTASESVQKFMESRPSFATALDMNSTVAKKPSGWFASYHRHFAYELLFTRERIGLLRYDVMVMFQSLNNIEKRILETEYVNWLLDGKLRCAAGETQDDNSISCQTVEDQLSQIVYQPATEASAVGVSMIEMPSNQLSDTEKENLEQIPGSEGRYTTIHFFQEASIMLDLPTKTAATAIMYHHRFKQFMADAHTNPVKEINGHQVDVNLALDCDDELLATTCLHLACKATEVVRKLRDVINVCYRLIHQSDSILEIDEYYYNLRTSLTTSELILIRALGYNLDVDLPFAFALKVLKGMGCVPVFSEDENDEQRWQKEVLSNGVSRSASNSEYPDKQKLQAAITKYFEDLDVDLALVARLTWIYAWDSMCHPSVGLEHDCYSIALACIYLAVRSAGASLPMNLVEWVHFWGNAHNVTIKSMKNALTSLMEQLAVVKQNE
ncbi:hypothetical protein NQZ79_g644 [Umbelopsis isabellina]|nr:hypothetical protein NQZ79_g644 [Umbelopsis isabellina]